MSTHAAVAARPPSTDAQGAVGVRPAAFRLSVALLIATAVGAGLSFLVPDVLGGVDVMDGSARGTGLVLTVVTVPMVAAAMALSKRGSTAAVLVWAGGVAHILYQSTLFLYGTPFNELFLVYCAMLALGIWAAVALLGGLDARALHAGLLPGMRRRPIAVYVWAIVGLNALGWIARIVPELSADEPAFLVGTGLTTNPVFVNDLAIWLPLMGIGAWWLWRDRPWGAVVVGAMLVMWQVEGLTVAVDQWMGSNADPGSTIATEAGAWLFVGMTLINLPPLVGFYRHVPRTRR